MAQSLVMNHQEIGSNENSVSTREFLSFEQACEAYKDSDDEIRQIFSEINKLSASNSKDNVIAADVDDVDLILKRAETIALESEKLLKNCPVTAKESSVPIFSHNNAGVIPEIMVTKVESDHEVNKVANNAKVSCF